MGLQECMEVTRGGRGSRGGHRAKGAPSVLKTASPTHPEMGEKLMSTSKPFEPIGSAVSPVCVSDV